MADGQKLDTIPAPLKVALELYGTVKPYIVPPRIVLPQIVPTPNSAECFWGTRPQIVLLCLKKCPFPYDLKHRLNK